MNAKELRAIIDSCEALADALERLLLAGRPGPQGCADPAAH
jgi:hypothetical protein